MLLLYDIFISILDCSLVLDSTRATWLVIKQLPPGYTWLLHLKWPNVLLLGEQSSPWKGCPVKSYDKDHKVWKEDSHSWVLSTWSTRLSCLLVYIIFLWGKLWQGLCGIQFRLNLIYLHIIWQWLLMQILFKCVSYPFSLRGWCHSSFI